MLIFFPLIYLCSFLFATRDIIKGNRQAILIYIVFGLSIYATSLNLMFEYGFKGYIFIAQAFKELIVVVVLGLNLWFFKGRFKFHFADHAVIAFFFYTLLYAILPIGENDLVSRFLAFKTTSYFALVYFTGRLFNPGAVYVNKYLHYILILAVATAAVVMFEVVIDQHLQTMTGFADYNFYFYNFEPSGNYGLMWTFESEGGFKRFASFFSTPLEHAAATLIALSSVAAVYTQNDNKLRLSVFGWIALLATFLSIIFALSRSSMASYALIFYAWAYITKQKQILNLIHAGIVAFIIYLILLFTDQKRQVGLAEVLVNTINFSNPSSVGHVVEWVQGIMAMISNPLGLGLGTSGRVASSLGENIGGENQFIIIGVQTGIIAIIIYVSIYVSILYTAQKWYPKLNGKDKKICLMVLLVKIGFIIPMLTSEIESSVYISYMNWFFSGLFISMISGKLDLKQNNAQTA